MSEGNTSIAPGVGGTAVSVSVPAPKRLVEYLSAVAAAFAVAVSVGGYFVHGAQDSVASDGRITVLEKRMDRLSAWKDATDSKIQGIAVDVAAIRQRSDDTYDELHRMDERLFGTGGVTHDR